MLNSESWTVEKDTWVFPNGDCTLSASCVLNYLVLDISEPDFDDEYRKAIKDAGRKN